MSLMIKTFWISLSCLFLFGFIALGFVGIPVKPVTVVKTISIDRLPQQ